MKKIVIVGALGYLGTELCKIYSGESYSNKIVAIDSRFVSERINQLKEWNIDSRPMFYPMSSFPMFKTQGENKIAKKIGDFGINLPSGYARTQEEVHYICDIIKHILGVA